MNYFGHLSVPGTERGKIRARLHHAHSVAVLRFKNKKPIFVAEFVELAVSARDQIRRDEEALVVTKEGALTSHSLDSKYSFLFYFYLSHLVRKRQSLSLPFVLILFYFYLFAF